MILVVSNYQTKKNSFFLFICSSTRVARGCGWQRVVTLINLGTFYLIGMPIAAFCGFKLKLYAKVLSYETVIRQKFIFLFLINCSGENRVCGLVW